MKKFEVLSRAQNIHQSYVIEASAGTGKTYSIENIVVRLLIDTAHPCTLEEILVVTFTRAATDDLKMRIRGCLAKTIALCRQALKGDQSSNSAWPDYFAAAAADGPERLKAMHRALENALANFQQAPIFTIHSFCHRMLREHILEANITLNQSFDDNGLPPAKVHAVIKDFFRTELHDSLLSPEQLKRSIQSQKGIDKLEQELYKLITKGVDIQETLALDAQMKLFDEQMTRLVHELPLNPDFIIEDFMTLAPAYKVNNKQNQPKPENIAKVKRFAELFHKRSWNIEDFDILIEDGLYLVEAYQPENRNSKVKVLPKEEELHYPQLTAHLHALAKVIDEARNHDRILILLAGRCKKMLQQYLEQEELLDFDGLLQQMRHALKNPKFTALVQKQFKAAIIDEFQDTDPTQWDIFKTLFAEGHFLYLVGDPKQSIYGFRQADIYTYLEARNYFGEEATASLEVNFRSSAPLIGALNALFDAGALPDLIALPRHGGSLPYLPVACGGLTKAKAFSDDRGSVHFFALEVTKENGLSKSLPTQEDDYFFPFIASEIQRLHRQDGCRFSAFAILVKDRFQAKRIEELLNSYRIPTVAQHTRLLVETKAFPALRELLQAILSPRDESGLKKALGGPILGWTHLDLLKLSDLQLWEACLAACVALRQKWSEEGFGPFFQNLMQSRWPLAEQSVAEGLMSREEGIDLYNDLQQLAELLAEEECRQQTPPHQLIDYFETLELLNHTEGKAIKRRNDPDKEGVQILTIHSSKGLEFEIVFALGIIKRQKNCETLLPIIRPGEPALLTVIDDLTDPRYLEHAAELDAEKMRQLYVTFTRAKQRLYIPMLCGDGLGKCEIGLASPLELYLARIGLPQNRNADLYQQIPHPEPLALFNFLQELNLKHSVSYTRLNGATFELERMPEPQADSLLRPPTAQIAGTPEFMHSFTSLSGNKAPAILSAVRPPSDFSHAGLSPHTLPAGRKTGILLHAILETAPFELARHGPRSPQLLFHVAKYTQHSAYKAWDLVICDIIYNTVTAKLPLGDGHFALSDVQADLCYREHEFVYATSGQVQRFLSESAPLTVNPGYLKGIIDLIFQHGDKYFIVDWKSNWLGENGADYGPDHLKEAMREHDYYLQAELYRQALQRYLRLCDPRPFEEIFGGVYYLFLRGTQSGTGQGVICL